MKKVLITLLLGALTMTSQTQAKPPIETAIFAGGCFWCMQPPYDKLPGVIKTTVGYTGGRIKNPSYDQICTGSTGHLEAVEIQYDSTKTTYKQLLDTFWKNIDPTTPKQQFADIGEQYQTAIFYLNPAQKKEAELSKNTLEHSKKFDRPIATEIRAASTFYPAEEYHQKYYQKESAYYQRYKEGSGRAAFIKKTWGTH